MPYSSISRTGCASSVPVSDFLQGQQQVRAEGEADNNCCTCSSFGNSSATDGF